MKRKLLLGSMLGLVLGTVLGMSVGAARADVLLQRVPGIIQSVNGDAIDVKTNAGVVHTTMTPDTKVAVITHAKPSDLKPGEFIGSAAARQPDGSFKALEVHVFPQSMRGTGQGDYPWDGPKVMMTNGAVAVLSGTKGRVMTVDYGNGKKDITVPTNIPIVNIGPGERSQVIKGKQVLVVGPQTKDATMPATYVILGTPGAPPPM